MEGKRGRERERWRARQRRNYRFNMAGGYEAFIRDRSPILNENWNVGSLGGNSPRSSNFDKTADYSATSVRFLPPSNIGLYICRCKKLWRKPFRKFPSNFPWNMKIIEIPLSLFASILGKRISSIDLSFLSILSISLSSIFRDWNFRRSIVSIR